MLSKRDLRQRIRGMLAALPQDVVSARSGAIAESLAALPEYHGADEIMIYLPLPGEVDTQPIALRAWSDAKRVFAPRVAWDQRRMIPIEIASLYGDFETDDYGVRSPIHGPPAPIADIDLVVVPGLGFDGRGNRLGRGRGFYDRFLAHPEFQGVTCAVAFEEQFVEEIPTAPNDIAVQILVTDASVRRFAR